MTSSKIYPNMSFQLYNRSSNKFNYHDFENAEESFISRLPIENLKIKKARCNRFIPSNDEKEKEKDMCQCGRKLSDHNHDVITRFQTYGIKPNEKWKEDTCSAEDGLTDAYGQVKFTNNNDNIAKYIRVHYKTDIQEIIQLLFHYWKLKEPRLLISVTGGAKYFTLSKRLRDVFRRGLVKAALSTNAWISTGGLNVGVMKHVGEAIREHALTLNPNETIVVLGIAAWSMVLHNEKLIKEENSRTDEPIDYSLKAFKENERKKPLDPNHSHFILVDNGKIGFGGEIDFRASLESAISKGKSGNTNLVIPVVVLVLEGGPGTLKTVYESVKNDSPCVFVEGSGKCADIFAYAIRALKEKERDSSHKDNSVKIDEKLKKEIKFRIKEEWRITKEEDVEKYYTQVEETLKFTDLISVFSLNTGDQACDIDVAILTSLLKAKKNNYVAQLKLALTWNRVDIARDYIFNQDDKIEPNLLDEIMYIAIINDNVDFVNLLFHNGINLKSFLTNRRLLKLYNDAFTNQKNKSIGYLSLLKNKRNIILTASKNESSNYDFKQIGSIIQELVEDLYEPEFTKEPYSKINLMMALAETNETGSVYGHKAKELRGVTANIHSDLDLDDKCKNPEYELFLFSILLLRPEMAKVFWSEGNNEIFLALLGSKIFRRLAKINDEDATRLLEYSKEFEEMAEKVLDDCYKKDEEKSQLLLIKQIKEFGNLTCLQVAISAGDLTFVSHPCVQGLLTKLWYNKILSDTSRLTLAFSVAAPFLAPIAIEYREDRTEKLRTRDKNGAVDRESTHSLIRNAGSNEIEFIDSGKHLSYFEKIYFFIKAPIIKFVYSQIYYVLFLMLFSYVMLCDFYPVNAKQNQTNLGLAISEPEIVLIIWIVLLTIDEIRQFWEIEVKVFRARFRIFFYNIWNCLEFLALILYYVGMILRFISDDVYLAARVVLCIDLVLWYLKSLSFYAAIRNLGPKLVMINRMLYELMYFIFIVIVFMFAFGVSTQALMYHNQELSADLLKEVFFPAYFIIGGEYYTRDTIMNANKCEQDRCPDEVGAQVTLALYVAYLIILNILLVNLLIAIFSNTFEEVQNETDKIWKFQRYSLIYEYFHKPILPAPFSLFSYFISLVRIVLRPIRHKCCGKLGPGEKNVFKRLFVYLSKDWRTGFVMDFNSQDIATLTKWENVISDEYLHSQEQTLRESTDYKIESTLERVEVLSRKFDELLDSRDELKKHVNKVEEKIDKIFELLKNNNSSAINSNTDNQVIPQVKESPVKQNPTSSVSDLSRILSPSSIRTLTAVETDNKILNIQPIAQLIGQVLNEKSRIPHYPKSNITRTDVPDGKVPWSIPWPDYKPIEYTAKSVLTNPVADINILAYPPIVRPEIDYNCVDERYKVDRRSFIGKYQVIDGLPLNPIGRTGVTGRGLLNFWGPNHAIEAIFTRWKKGQNGKHITNDKHKKVLQILVIQKSLHLRQWYLPHVILERKDEIDHTLKANLLPQIFDEEVIAVKENYEKLRDFLYKGETVDKYYKDCQRNTDNAWIETIVINYHDESGDLLHKLNLKDVNGEANPIWKDFESTLENENDEDWIYLKKIAESKHASF